MKNGNIVPLLAVLGVVLGCSSAKAPGTDVSAAAAASVVGGAAGTSLLQLDPALDVLVASGAPVEKVAGGFQFTEGPMWRDGRLWFSDLAGNRMYAVTPEGKVELLIDNSGGLKSVPAKSFKGSNAMVTDKDGSVLMCRHGMRDIVRLDSALHEEPFISKFEGKRLNSPNDLVFAPDGSLWITDPPFGLTGQDKDPAKELRFNGVFRYANGKLTAPIRDLPKPNGIGFSPDGRTLYVSNSGPKMFVNKYAVAADGTLSNPTRLITYPDQPTNEVPDGLKVDSAGNIWSSGPGGIRIISPNGKVLGQIRLPEVAANMAWADNGSTLYITGSTSIYRLRVKTPGEIPRYIK